jgi:hypothetical protein
MPCEVVRRPAIEMMPYARACGFSEAIMLYAAVEKRRIRAGITPILTAVRLGRDIGQALVDDHPDAAHGQLSHDRAATARLRHAAGPGGRGRGRKARAR